jgi:hypothetical protein
MQRNDTVTNLIPLPLESEVVPPLEEIAVAGSDIGRPEERILVAINLFDQLTAEQLSRHLSYSFRYTQNICKALADKKYLQRLTLPKRTQGGGVPYVYTLARKGRQYLTSQDADLGAKVKSRYRPSEVRARLHTLATNETLLQVMQAADSDPNLSLERFIPEIEFLNEPIKVTIPQRSISDTVSLIPDLWIQLRQQVGSKAYTYCFCIEVNLTSLEQKRWRRKVSMYLNCSEGYKKRVGIDVLQILTIINSQTTVLRRGAGAYKDGDLQDRKRGIQAAEKTMLDYINWTEKELREQEKREEADLFLFTSMPLDVLTPVDILFSAHNTSPYAPEPVPLIFKGEEEQIG